MNGQVAPRYTWEEERQHAQTRPAMYLGDQATAHRTCIIMCLRLIWQAKVFRHPQSVTIDLSPTQYVVRAECGSLIRPIQQNFRFGIGETLVQPWQEDGPAYFKRIAREQEEKGTSLSLKWWNSRWRYCFSGPTGPRLASPTYPFILARYGIWGLRTNEGLWCEAYQEGAPVGKPFLLRNPSPTGLLSAAALNPEWFTSLPFTEEDAGRFADMSHHRYVSHPKYEVRPLWTPGDITANWHPQDDLISDKMLTAEGLQELL